MKYYISNEIFKYLRRNELDEFRKIKNVSLKYRAEINSFNMFRYENFNNSYKNKWKLYKNLRFEWMEQNERYDIRIFETIMSEPFNKTSDDEFYWFYKSDQLYYFSFSDKAKTIKKIVLFGESFNDKSFEWIENFKNLQEIHMIRTNVTDEFEKRLLKMKYVKIRSITRSDYINIDLY